jgi:hypothetical protein
MDEYLVRAELAERQAQRARDPWRRELLLEQGRLWRTLATVLGASATPWRKSLFGAENSLVARRRRTLH